MKAPQRPKDVAEDDLTLYTSQNAWRKWQTQYKSSTREKAANTVMWSPVSDKPILQTMLFNFSQPPPTILTYGLIGRVNTPKRQNWHVDKKREVNTGIKGEERQGRKGRKKGSYKKNNGKNVMLLGLSPRTQTLRATPMWSLAILAKPTFVWASMKITTKLPSNDQGPAFLAHSLWIILFGPFTYEPNVILESLNNCVLTIIII